MLAGGVDVLGGGADARALFHRAGVVVTLAHGNHHAATREFQVEARHHISHITLGMREPATGKTAEIGIVDFLFGNRGFGVMNGMNGVIHQVSEQSSAQRFLDKKERRNRCSPVRHRE